MRRREKRRVRQMGRLMGRMGYGFELQSRFVRLRTAWRMEQRVHSRHYGRLEQIMGCDPRVSGKRDSLLNGGVPGEAGLKFWALDWELIERRVRES